MKHNPHDILIRPLLIEKITSLRDKKNCVSFVVSNRATRIDVGQSVESVLKVKVKSVNIMNVKGKPKRRCLFRYYTIWGSMSHFSIKN